MLNRQALTALVDEAARDPSGARRLLELAAEMVKGELALGDYATPPGYLYAGAHTWVLEVEDLKPESLPSVTDPPPQSLALTTTANQAQPLEVPFDGLILGVAGWATPALPRELPDADAKTAALLVGADPDGRDLFSLDWKLNGETSFVTDGQLSMMEPALALVGTRTRPRPLAWIVRRGDLIAVRFRNLTNVAVPFQVYAQQSEPYGWPIAASLAFLVLNLERP